MLIKKAKYEKVKVWQNQCVSQEVHGCDQCKSVIDEYPNEDMRLECKIFFNDHGKQTTVLHFCSWDCVLKHIPKLKTDYFVTLPHLYFDTRKESKMGANQLINLLKTAIIRECKKLKQGADY